MQHPTPLFLFTISIAAFLFSTSCQPDSPAEPPQALESIQESKPSQQKPSPPEDPDSIPLRTDFHAPFPPLPSVPDSLDELPEGVNPVQLEMQLLTEGMNNILRLIADNRLDGIAGQIRQIHPAYELTHQAIESGAYRPPQNSDQIEEFIAMDDEFHDLLRALLRASRENDLQAAAERYGDLVQGCTSCHAQFRFP